MLNIPQITSDRNTMELTLTRKYKGPDCVIGELYLNGNFECYTLEDVERPKKIPGITAIPKGTYEVVIDFSKRFRKLMPRLLKVPEFEGILIHSGNYASDTEGCILVGKVKEDHSIGYSRDAFERLFPKLRTASLTEKIVIKITDQQLNT
jgi:hypothetical protein